jgi:hypothetical protein
MNRSVAAQIEHWASIGRAVEGCLSAAEIKSLFARAAHSVSEARPGPYARLVLAPERHEGMPRYEARIRHEDPMPRLIARAGAAQVVEVGQEELSSAKVARQLVDYAVQRERIVPWKAISRFSGAGIKAKFRKVPLER